MVILWFVPPTPFSFLKLLKNGQSVLGYRTRRAVSNDTKINPGLNFGPIYRQKSCAKRGFAKASPDYNRITLCHNFVKSCSIMLILMSFESARQALSNKLLFV